MKPMCEAPTPVCAVVKVAQHNLSSLPCSVAQYVHRFEQCVSEQKGYSLSLSLAELNANLTNCCTTHPVTLLTVPSTVNSNCVVHRLR